LKQDGAKLSPHKQQETDHDQVQKHFFAVPTALALLATLTTSASAVGELRGWTSPDREELVETGSGTLVRPAKPRPRTMTGRSTARFRWLTSLYPPWP